MREHAIRVAVVTAVLAVLLTGCGWRGLNSLPMPGTEGRGPGAFTITAQLPDVTTVQQNARVRVGDVNVGTVTKIERQGWHALVSMRLNGDVDLPANAVAKVGQTSLFGSTHIELAQPTDAPPQGKLREGSMIPLDHGETYPTTERTLAAVALLLNGGGVGEIQEITTALHTAFAGREQDLRDLIGELDRFIAAVDTQTDDIIAATDSLNNLVSQIAEQKPVVDKALKTVPDALAVLRDRREELAEALVRFGELAELTADTVEHSKEALAAELRDLAPVLKSLADAGPALTRSLGFLSTLPFPKETLANWFRGDYANLTAIIDLTLSRIDSSFFTGTRWEGDLTELELQWGRTIGQLPSPYTAANPLVAPYRFDQGP